MIQLVSLSQALTATGLNLEETPSTQHQAKKEHQDGTPNSMIAKGETAHAHSVFFAVNPASFQVVLRQLFWNLHALPVRLRVGTRLSEIFAPSTHRRDKPLETARKLSNICSIEPVRRHQDHPAAGIAAEQLSHRISVAAFQEMPE